MGHYLSELSSTILFYDCTHQYNHGWMWNSNGFNLSYPSKCQQKFGPWFWYCLRFRFLVLRLTEPSGSSCFKASKTASPRTNNPWNNDNLCQIDRLPELLLGPDYSSQTAVSNCWAVVSFIKLWRVSLSWFNLVFNVRSDIAVLWFSAKNFNIVLYW